MPDDRRREASAGAETPNPGLTVELRGVGKCYGQRQVLNPLNLRIEAGEFLALVGRSGCGKSTLLRLLAGLEAPSEGNLSWNQASSPRGDVRLMFQEARLLPWKRVADNVALGLPGIDGIDRARQALSQVGLADRARDWPTQLSGGQRQRVALARALVHRPRLLLLDEPLGALDALTRLEMHTLIERLWRTHQFTAVLVTHDVGEAVALADRVVLLESQRVAWDQAVALPRPRERGSAAFAATEKQWLSRVLQGSTLEPEFHP